MPVLNGRGLFQLHLSMMGFFSSNAVRGLVMVLNPL